MVGQLGLMSFRSRRVSGAAELQKLLTLVDHRFRRNLNWAVARSKVFAIRSTDDMWRPTVGELMKRVDAILIDVTEVTDGLCWELSAVQDPRSVRRLHLPQFGRFAAPFRARRRESARPPRRLERLRRHRAAYRAGAVPSEPLVDPVPARAPRRPGALADTVPRAVTPGRPGSNPGRVHSPSDPHGHGEIRDRFTGCGELLVGALRAVGADARLGPVPGEYCPGEFSINDGRGHKLVGTAQRLVRGAWLFGTVILVTDPEPVRSVLVDVYRALGLDWDPATVAAVQDSAPGVTVTDVQQAVLRTYSGLGRFEAAALPGDLLVRAASRVERHRVPEADCSGLPPCAAAGPAAR